MYEKMAGPELLKNCFMAACANVEKNKEYINELNVFPVPDGDTGTNVSMTLGAALREVEAAPLTMEGVCKAISQGTLRGARGNSGVIFSQLLRGFTKAIRELPAAGPEDLAAGFKRGTDTAYKAVMKPKEGTILTVARGMSDKIEELAPTATDIYDLLVKVCEYGDEVLSRTPEMLPVLKEAGVVDSGGMALMMAVHGAVSALSGEPVDIAVPVSETREKAETESGHVHISTDDIRFGYCTECIINLEKEFTEKDHEELTAYLSGIGDSLVCVSDEDVVKIHVHTNHPGLVFEKGLAYGSLSRLKVDNLHEEHEERLLKEINAKKEKAEETAPVRDVACVAVCTGDGLSDIFRELGADYVIGGGQTMNPSIEDILTACKKVRARDVLVLPNNKNIILASQQAGECTDGSFHVVTIPSTSVVQGITALMNYDPEAGITSNMNSMTESLGTVKSGEVTYAIRTTTIDGREIREGDIMGLCDGHIYAAGEGLQNVTLQMIEKMTDEDTSLISVYRGADVSLEEAESLIEKLREQYPRIDVDLLPGGQPVYYYFVSVE